LQAKQLKRKKKNIQKIALRFCYLKKVNKNLFNNNY